MEQTYYIGIDLDDTCAVVSYYLKGMKEPETLSPVAGSEKYQIPVDGSMRTKENLTAIFKKLLLMASRLGNPTLPDCLAVTIGQLDPKTAHLIGQAVAEIGLPKENLLLFDRRECFYYYVYSQKEELFLHDVMLFDYRDEVVRSCFMHRNTRTVPQTIEITGQEYQMEGEPSDTAFAAFAKSSLDGKICSSVFLSGDGFEGEWMKQSLVVLCRGRKAFIGKNLYAKGACYGAIVRRGKTPWPYLYLGENEMKINVGIRARVHGEIVYYTLIEGGESRYEARGECEAVLKHTDEIEVWCQHLTSGKEKREPLKLTNLPGGTDAVTRIRIEAKPLTDCEVELTVRDLGFGEIRKSHDQTWTYTVSV